LLIKTYVQNQHNWALIKVVGWWVIHTGTYVTSSCGHTREGSVNLDATTCKQFEYLFLSLLFFTEISFELLTLVSTLFIVPLWACSQATVDILSAYLLTKISINYWIPDVCKYDHETNTLQNLLFLYLIILLCIKPNRTFRIDKYHYQGLSL